MMWTSVEYVSRARRVLVCASMLAAVACGDDDTGKRDAASDVVKSDAAIKTSDAGAKMSAADSGSTPLVTNIGKACEADTDCAGDARCASTLIARPGAAAENARDGYCTMSCRMAAECGQGAACVGGSTTSPGYCGLSCQTADDCRAGYRCVRSTGASSGTCQPLPQTDKLADGIVGKACTAAGDCGSGSCLQSVAIVNTPYPGGYCTGRCLNDDACGNNGVCVPGMFGAVGSCFLRCDESQGCERTGYRCRVVSGVGRCVAADPPLPDHSAGNACMSDQDCGGGAMSCASSLGATPAPGGYCTQSCAINADCGAGGTCINGINVVTINSGRCLKLCMQPEDCRKGYECRLFGGPSSDGPGACMPLSEQDAGAL